MTTFEENEKIVYTIHLTGKQIREFLSAVEADDNPSLMWLEKIIQKAVCNRKKGRSTKGDKGN